MKIMMQANSAGGLNMTSRAPETGHAQTAGDRLSPGKRLNGRPYDLPGDAESVRLMEERYGIKDEGLF